MLSKQLARLNTALPTTLANLRQGFDSAAIRDLARSDAIRQLAGAVLGEECFAVRAIFFNKTSSSNWKVSWHQDCAIAVKERCHVEGWGRWSVKAGIPHVRPTASVLENMVAVRVHLDDCGIDNGPLRVLPGTHQCGILGDSEITSISKQGEVACAVKRGDALLMRPLLLHASSASSNAGARRVVHIEFAGGDLPEPAVWHARIA
jgi:ectoine hydroxylase-related dioxygenase (phytanoyl-CoA dioxygenase family)